MTKTKIDWCDWTWNPVWGCETGCPYCYARKIAKRFGKVVANQNNVSVSDVTSFKPTFLPNNFEKPFPKKPSRIFVNSMSDIYWWKIGWIWSVLDKIKQDKKHRFMFLTKFPRIYGTVRFPQKCYLGVSDTGNGIKIRGFVRTLYSNTELLDYRSFVSIEPMQFEIDYSLLEYIDWIIIGAQTNPLKLPKKEWVEKIIEWTRKNNKPLFMKHNLAPLGIPLIQEYL